MKPTIPNYQNSQVLIVGDIMLDQYWYGSTGRISPEAPVPVVKVAPQGDEVRAGGAANVAMNIAALGGQAQLIGLAGNDAAKDDLLDILGGLSIRTDLALSSQNPTIKKLRVLSRSQQLIRIDFEEPFTPEEQKTVADKMIAQLRTAGVVILSDYAKGALAHAPLMIEQARQAGTPVFIDPKGNDFEPYCGATLLTPNMSEFECVVGAVHSDQELFDKGNQLIERYDLQALLVTRSEHGMTLLQKGKAPFHLPTEAKEVFDVTGAGDTVISVLAASVAAGSSLEEACVLANAAAGVVVGKLGTSTLSDIELAEAIYGGQDINFGVTNEAALIQSVKAAQQKGEKVVMTNGCFDILHAGHVSYLNHAAQLGDRLIVAVNTDESVKRLKGENRPINHTERRMTVLSSLGAVDWVVPFSEDTPQRLIASVLPDLLVKGGDYQVEQIAGGAEVIAAGGEVKVLNFEDGCSTSEIIRTIKNQ